MKVLTFISTIFLIAMTFFIARLTLAMRPDASAIYGKDDRVEVSEFSNKVIREYAKAVAGKVEYYQLYEPFFDLDLDLDSDNIDLSSLRGKVDDETFSFLERLVADAKEEKELEEKDNKKFIKSSAEISKVIKYHLSRYLEYQQDNFYEFEKHHNIQSVFNACSDSRFKEQTVLTNCTGFLIGPDTLVTAGHCVRDEDACEDSLWVFDYVKGTNLIDKKNVFACKKILNSVEEHSPIKIKDYAVIKLDRIVKNRTPLKVRTRGRISSRAKVATIGHPLGLPMKIATGKVKGNGLWRLNTFETNLDLFQGNSGSPVINLKTGLVEGLVVSGEDDFHEAPSESGCRKDRYLSKRRGNEDILRIKRVKY